MPALGGGRWHAGDDTVSRIHLDTGAATDTIDVGPRPEAVAVSADSVWVTNTYDDTLSRIGRV
jgi:DNA-binding beta-propeller fold protein YncE